MEKKEEKEKKPKTKKANSKKSGTPKEAKPKKPRAKKEKAVKAEAPKVEEVAPKKFVAQIKSGTMTVDEKYRQEKEIPTEKGPVWLSFSHVTVSAPTDLVCEVCPYFGKCNTLPDPKNLGNPRRHFLDYCGELDGMLEEVPAKGSLEETFSDWPEFGFNSEEQK
jgi:hypothetical protein